MARRKGFFGSNWRTSLSGMGGNLMIALAILANAPYALGDIAMIFPPEWKDKIVVIGLVAGFVLKTIQAQQQKDKAVTGGVEQNDVKP